MKNLTYILVLLLVIAGCKNANVANTQEHIDGSHPTSPSVASLPKPAVSTPDKDKPIEAPDIELITDFKNWNHPIKSVFDKYNLHPDKMELSRNKVFLL